MKRILLVVVCAASLSIAGWAQEPAHSAEPGAAAHSAEGHDEGDPYIWWKWANFAILAAALGYMLNRALPPFFAGRTAEIQKGIAEAAKAKMEADQRAAAMQQRLAALGTEIEQIKVSAQGELAKESDRIRTQTAQQLARLQAQAEQEIAAITKQSISELKAQAARLALELAEQRARTSINPAIQGALVDRFVRNLHDYEQGARL